MEEYQKNQDREESSNKFNLHKKLPYSLHYRYKNSHLMKSTYVRNQLSKLKKNPTFLPNKNQSPVLKYNRCFK